MSTNESAEAVTPEPVWIIYDARALNDTSTVLSRKYKLGIAGKPVLFVLEDDDLVRTYSVNKESELSYE